MAVLGRLPLLQCVKHHCQSFLCFRLVYGSFSIITAVLPSLLPVPDQGNGRRILIMALAYCSLSQDQREEELVALLGQLSKHCVYSIIEPS